MARYGRPWACRRAGLTRSCPGWLLRNCKRIQPDRTRCQVLPDNGTGVLAHHACRRIRLESHRRDWPGRRQGPGGALRDEFARLLRDVRAGKPRSDALRELAARMDMPAVSSFVATLIQAEATGMSLGPILRAQADQRRVERFARAEKLAMEAPVKLLGNPPIFSSRQKWS
ncbi:MAG: type II secretion system F family protein [Thiobacillus sp.]